MKVSVKVSKETIKRIYDEFGRLIGGFLGELNDESLYIVFEKVVDEMNKRKEAEQKED